MVYQYMHSEENLQSNLAVVEILQERSYATVKILYIVLAAYVRCIRREERILEPFKTSARFHERFSEQLVYDTDNVPPYYLGLYNN